jgi:hypothetical protein
MYYLNHTIPIVFGLSMTISVYARDWGFSKDTVYEWKLHGDNVLLRNQGTDTLRADTLILEIIRPANILSSLGVIFLYEEGINSCGAGTTNSSSGMYPYCTISTPPNKSDSLFGFYIDFSSRSTVAVGDTIGSRLILAASSNRGRDTLILIGIQQVSGILRCDNFKQSPANGRYYDLNGRLQHRINVSPDESRVSVPAAFAPEKGFLFLLKEGGP